MARDPLQVALDIAPLFYEGVLDSNHWYIALDSLCRELEAMNFHQVTLGPAHEDPILESMASETVPGDKLEEYEQQYMGRDERVALLDRMVEGEVVFDHHHFDQRHMSRSAVYDFLRGVGTRYSMCMVMRQTAGTNAYLAMLRPVDHRPYGEREEAVMRLLAPEILRATRLRDHTRELARRAALGTAAMEHMPFGIVIVDAGRRIQYLNARAASHVREAVWCAGYSRFALRQQALQLQLEQAVARACSASRCAAVVRWGSGADTVVLRILPLPAVAVASVAGRSHSPLALIAMAMPYAGLSFSCGELGAVLGITTAEAELASVLAGGGTIKAFAMARGCTLNTARSHLKSLLAKTGCKRQLDLVRLIHAVGQG